jgi:predicted ATP-grasp superfamily ATP-dependent carboligase
VLLYSRDSRLVAAFTTAKKRQWPTTGGLTVVSRSTRDEAIIEQVKPFFEHWKWKGPAEIEIKWDALTGVNKVIEINPRVPAS